MTTGPLFPPKDYKSYEELVEQLSSRGMTIECTDRAKRKLAQVGYYRLSGFSYACRKLARDSEGQVVMCPILKNPTRENDYYDDTTFNNVFNLYLFDKRLRVLMLDALERIEVFIRSVIAHEIGKGSKKKPGSGELEPDPMAWNNPDYINPKHLKKKNGKSNWDKWLANHAKLIERSREDCIKWHKENNKSMPFWVVIEAWDFGTLSKYFGMLKDTYRSRICQRLGLSNPQDANTLGKWLLAMNILRNRCAHHSRVWNQRSNAALPIPNTPYFDKLNLDSNCLARLFGLAVIMNFLLKQLGPSSTWMHDVLNAISGFPKLPGCNLRSLGVPASGLPELEDLGLQELTLVKAG